MQLVLKQIKDVGIDTKLDQKEYGAYQASCRLGKFDSLGFGPSPRSSSRTASSASTTRRSRATGVTSTTPYSTTCVRQRRTADLKQRRDIIHQIQRHLA